MIKTRFKKMENAYGIKKLDVNYEEKTLYQALIYSSNGTFKTSFSRALYNLSIGNDEDIQDRITNEPSSIEIEFLDENNNYITDDCKDKFIVFSRELYDGDSRELSNLNNELRMLTIDEKKKAELSKLLTNSIDRVKNDIISKLKSLGLNIDKSMILLFGKNDDEINLEDISNFLSDLKKVEIKDVSKVNIKKIFQKAYDPIDNKDFMNIANNYLTILNKRIKDELFDENFNDSNCLDFLDNIKKNGYLNKEKSRGIIIKGEPYYKYEDVEKKLNDAIKNISEEPEILKVTNELIKAMGNSTEAKNLKSDIKNDPMLINQLALGKKRIIQILLKNQKLDIESYEKDIEETKKRYLDILNEANKSQSVFEKAITIYKNRFNPVFDIEIVNKSESILGINIPILVFKHERNPETPLSESYLRTILSSGEKTALNIISLIVEYEAKKEEDPILILDDLVETFDYANRHAFIEYINDLINRDNSVIVLTHNYEFYRTLNNRIKKLSPLAAYSQNGKVFIEENQKLNFNIEKVFEIQSINQLIASIPFLREIKIMTKEETDIMNSCLHYKEKTKDILMKEIIDEYPKEIASHLHRKLHDDEEKNYLTLLYEKADSMRHGNQYDIISKMIISIACRLKIEEKIIGDRFELIKDINSNQLRELKNKYETALSEKTLELIDKVQISTPEFIHCNSFMIEPLVDIDGSYLNHLYVEVKALEENNIWK